MHISYCMLTLVVLQGNGKQSAVRCAVSSIAKFSHDYLCGLTSPVLLFLTPSPHLIGNGLTYRYVLI